jgi:hypothetical protein
MNCLNCTHLTTKPRAPGDPKATAATADMARNGFGTCLRQPAYVFMSPSYERECAMFVQAPAEQMPARLKWATT